MDLPVYDSLLSEPFWRDIKGDSEQALQTVSNALLELDAEVQLVYGRLRSLYAPRFPQLLSVKMSPKQFADIIKLIGSSQTLFDLPYEQVLPPMEAMALKMSAVSAKGQCVDVEECLKLAQTLDRMFEVKKELDDYVLDKMGLLAPNISAIVGPEIACKLVSSSGGLVSLSRCPANNIQVIGSRDRSAHVGWIGQCDLVTQVPFDQSHLRKNAMRLIAAKVALAARIDALGEDFRDGSFGAQRRKEVEDKLERLLEPLPFKSERPLPPPILHARKRRGGKRARRLKELTAMTELRRRQNRMVFGGIEEDVMVGEDVRGMGMIGMDGPRITAVDPKLRERIKKQSEKALVGIYRKDGGQQENPFSFNAEHALLLKKPK